MPPSCQVPRLRFRDRGETGKQVRFSTKPSLCCPRNGKQVWVHPPQPLGHRLAAREGDEPSLASPETGLSTMWKYRGVTVLGWGKLLFCLATSVPDGFPSLLRMRGRMRIREFIIMRNTYSAGLISLLAAMSPPLAHAQESVHSDNVVVT